MLSHLSGTVVSLTPEAVVLDVSGVGYRISCTPQTIAQLTVRGPATILTYLAVRETALDLYGFIEESDRHMFELLRSVSGIGPKSALAILSSADTETLMKAISEHDSSYLTKVGGIGKKTAEKIVVELKEKLGSVDTHTGKTRTDTDVLDALMALGYSAQEARDALRHIDDDITDTNQKITAALRLLGT